jgi:hypothetical protein
MQTKICKDCGLELTINNFEGYIPKFKDKVYPRNTRNYCRKCQYIRRKGQRKGKAYVDRGDVSYCNGCSSWLPKDKFSINCYNKKPYSKCKKCRARQAYCVKYKEPFMVLNINYYEFFIGDAAN